MRQGCMPLLLVATNASLDGLITQALATGAVGEKNQLCTVKSGVENVCGLS